MICSCTILIGYEMFLSRAKPLAFLAVLTFALAASSTIMQDNISNRSSNEKMRLRKICYQHVLKQEVSADKALGFNFRLPTWPATTPLIVSLCSIITYQRAPKTKDAVAPLLRNAICLDLSMPALTLPQNF